jgi:UPF0755 protein
LKKLVVLAIIGIFLGSILGLGFVGYNFMNTPASQDAQEVVFEVEPGLSFTAVAKKLEKLNLISNADLLILYAKINKSIAQIKVGEYMISPHMLPLDIIDILKSGKSIERKITISEGLNMFEIANIFAEAGFGNLASNIEIFKDKELVKQLLGEDYESLEGYLYPETYTYTKYTPLKTIISQMVQLSNENWNKVKAKAESRAWTKHQVFTLASIIEKETGAGDERPLISSVFFNRLKKNMMLQTDPTVLYAKNLHLGLTPENTLQDNITRADLSFQHPYNTYTIKGLPPGPIANPGLASLQAAVEPAETDYLFFVSRNDGTHVFTKEYGDHKKAVSQFQLDAKAREGKSWRDLNKKKD